MGEIDDEKEANMNLKEVGLEEILEAQSRQLAEKEEQDSLSTNSPHVFTSFVITNKQIFHEILFVQFSPRYNFLIEIKLWKKF